MIDEVPYSDILNIRQEVMYPDQNKECCILPDDENGLHVGFYVDDRPVSIVSLFLENRELQFRKFATLTKYQNKGYGSKLLEWILDYANDMNFNRVWCNARIDKTAFYKKFGFIETSQSFEKNGLKYIIMEIKALQP